MKRLVIDFIVIAALFTFYNVAHQIHSKKQTFKHNEDYEDIDFLTRKKIFYLTKPETTIKIIKKRIIIKKREVDTVYIDTSKEKIRIVKQLQPFEKVRLISFRPQGIQIYELQGDSLVRRYAFKVSNPWIKPTLIYRDNNQFYITYPRFSMIWKNYIQASYQFPNTKSVSIGRVLLLQGHLMLDGYLGVGYSNSWFPRLGITLRYYF